VKRVIDADEMLAWINEMIENTKPKTARWVALKDLEREVKRIAVRLAEPQIKGRKRSLEKFYSHILPIIRALQKEGKTTAYAITKALNERGEKTFTGRMFRDMIVTKLMKLADERKNQLDFMMQKDDGN